ADEVEAIGIRKSYEALAEADLVLVVTDNSSLEQTKEDELLLETTSGRKRILVRNKSDLAPSKAENIAATDHLPEVSTSALTGEGIEVLRRKIVAEVGGGSAGQRESGFVTNLRQQKLIEEALLALSAAEQAIHNRTPHEM